jgi:hypothetical protein
MLPMIRLAGVTPSERQIQTVILQWLLLHGIKAYRINAGMLATGEGRAKRMVRLAPAGFSDIVGVLPKTGRAVFIEVKRPKGKLTIWQEQFLREMKEQGAIAFVAYGVEDCERELGNNMKGGGK